MNTAKIIIEVTAGLVPEKPESEFTRKWAITSEEWEAAVEPNILLAEFNGKALGYASLLMLQPHAINWVRTDFIYL